MTEPNATLVELREILARHGNITRLARAVGVTRQAVSSWLEVGNVPPRHVLKVEQMTGIPRHQLNPEIYPPPQWLQPQALA